MSVNHIDVKPSKPGGPSTAPSLVVVMTTGFCTYRSSPGSSSSSGPSSSSQRRSASARSRSPPNFTNRVYLIIMSDPHLLVTHHGQADDVVHRPDGRSKRW